MDIHKNARTCPRSRDLLCERVLTYGWSLRRAAEAAGLSERRAREWVRRKQRRESLADRSSRPQRSHSIRPRVRARILKLRRQWMTVRQIAAVVGVSHSTVARVCRREGLNRLKRLESPPPSRRYECDHPGDLIHIDVKKLGRFDNVGHRITRDRSRGSSKRGWDFVFVATDDHSRVTFADILPNERRESACEFLRRTVAWFHQIGITPRRILTDNGSAFVSRDFKRLCHSLGIRHSRIRPYRPQTNGKVERMIQTLLREWAYRFSYRTSTQRKRWLEPFLHFYNVHRAHSALNYNPPISRLDRNNLLTLNS